MLSASYQKVKMYLNPTLEKFVVYADSLTSCALYVHDP